MRLLLLHSDWIEFEPLEKALKAAEEIEKEKKRVEDALVVFVSVEDGDSEKTVKNAAGEILDVAEQVGAKRVVLYPFVHLSSKPASPGIAFELLKALEKELGRSIEVHRAPFGWYKRFAISVKGHPLSELSRVVKAIEEAQEEEGGHYSIAEAFVVDVDGSILSEEEAKKRYEAVRAVIRDEKGEKISGEAGHIKLMKQLKIAEKEPVADAGCLRWLPPGAMMFELLRRHAWNKIVSLGYVYPFVSPTIIEKSDPGVLWLVEHFPERHYKVIPGGKVPKQKQLFLKTAGDYGVFSMHRDAHYSYRELPVGLYELEVDYRYEQRGELRGMHRLREFHMQNIHTVCKDIDEGWKVFEDMWRVMYEILRDAGADADVFVLYSERDLWEKFRERIIALAKDYRKPILVFIVENVQVYMGAWIDIVVLDLAGRPIEAGTAQLDVRSAKYWNITYVDEKGEKQFPIIVHAGFGMERAFAAAMERMARGLIKSFPLWLAEVQVRVVPVSRENLTYAKRVAEKLNAAGIRVELDDRDLTLSKRIREAEMERIPIVVVVGKKEEEEKMLAVRFRDGGQRKMSVEELISYVEANTKGFPGLPLPGPLEVSSRPRWRG